ncbi:pentapeptide repeat-containing protein [Solwaraspora sp. WMMD792]|uniref:pentapeptide repeat-containing protein n=1 Tax=Solwaraspora sp. WMMD792 TaxID=3016099 RepID=UPI002417EC18|nr:pentapeptide repeat-containing protein [Solwaraspora sp. WMMD792]MDG4770975.1 pentapeptide repeat-containing protein [Solwaraspora sp. WMMD792]
MIKHWKAATPAVAGMAALLAAAVLLLPGRLWPTLGRLIVGHWLVLLLAVVGVTGLAVGGVLWRRSRLTGESSAAPVPPQRPLRPLPTWMILVGALVVAGITWAAVWGLQATVPAGIGTPLEAAQLRVETIRTGLSVGAGAGAAAALLLALRRQQVTERTQQATEYDAGEKRVTELYVKAAEQLGSDKAPVRLAGLYALERLAQDNPVHRQNMVEIICAYLRMPYSTSRKNDQVKDGSESVTGSSEGSANGTADATGQPDPREERQVRLAAQRILARHLRPKSADGTLNPMHWHNVSIDLTEATLLDPDFTDCNLRSARFSGATFTGPARFSGATFTGPARFSGATFTGPARFSGATFTGEASFDRATFTGEAWFDRATFTGDAAFSGVAFTGNTWFDRATFTGPAWFGSANFTRKVGFGRTTFTGPAWFGGATFTGDASFSEATFTGDAWFGGTTFAQNPSFDSAIVGGGDRDKDAWPAGWRVDPATRRLEGTPVSEKPEIDPGPKPTVEVRPGRDAIGGGPPPQQ